VNFIMISHHQGKLGFFEAESNYRGLNNIIRHVVINGGFIYTVLIK